MGGGLQRSDADRIAAVVQKVGLSSIDYLVVTHYHADHVGGVPALAARVPIRTFVDHGPTVVARGISRRATSRARTRGA